MPSTTAPGRAWRWWRAARCSWSTRARTARATCRVRSAGRPGRIAAVFLTHYHSDHIDGLGEMGLLRWVGGSHRDPLPLYGPEGLLDVAEGFERAYQFDARYRVAHHGAAVVPPEGAGFAPQPFAAPALGECARALERDGIRVSAFRVEHEPVSPAVGYRFDYGGRSLVVSGDTKKSDSLLAQARGVDLIVHEALSPKLVGILHDAAESAGNANLAKIMTDIPDYHTTPVEAGRDRAGRRRAPSAALPRRAAAARCPGSRARSSRGLGGVLGRRHARPRRHADLAAERVRRRRRRPAVNVR